MSVDDLLATLISAANLFSALLTFIRRLIK